MAGKTVVFLDQGLEGYFPYPCGMRKTLTGCGTQLLKGKRDSPKFGHECDIRHSDDRTSG